MFLLPLLQVFFRKVRVSVLPAFRRKYVWIYSCELSWCACERDFVIVWQTILSQSHSALMTAIQLESTGPHGRIGFLGLLSQAWQSFWKNHLELIIA